MGKSKRLVPQRAYDAIHEILVRGAEVVHLEEDRPVTLLSQKELGLAPNAFVLVDHEGEYTAVMTVELIDHNRPTDLEQALDNPATPMPPQG